MEDCREITDRAKLRHRILTMLTYEERLAIEPMLDRYDELGKRPTGHWIEKEFTGRTGDGRIFKFTMMVCSECEREADELTEFCPYCGAYIIKGEEE